MYKKLQTLICLHWHRAILGAGRILTKIGEMDLITGLVEKRLQAFIVICKLGLVVGRAYKRGLQEIHRTRVQDDKGTQAKFFCNELLSY